MPQLRANQLAIFTAKAKPILVIAFETFNLGVFGAANILTIISRRCLNSFKRQMVTQEIAIATSKLLEIVRNNHFMLVATKIQKGALHPLSNS
ncbi:hypothetical protein ABRG53_1192 [Pseudanabaena sp. ABRG5-3]|nr:hypothetical protein ABRG53_1192 [Pseudanabaena sp. ABRG5-3]